MSVQEFLTYLFRNTTSRELAMQLATTYEMRTYATRVQAERDS